MLIIGVYFFWRLFPRRAASDTGWGVSEGRGRHTSRTDRVPIPGTRLGRDIGLGPAEDFAGPLLGRDRNESKL